MYTKRVWPEKSTFYAHQLSNNHQTLGLSDDHLIREKSISFKYKFPYPCCFIPNSSNSIDILQELYSPPTHRQTHGLPIPPK